VHFDHAVPERSHLADRGGAAAFHERAGVQGSFEHRDVGQGYALREPSAMGEAREGFVRGGERIGGAAFRGGEGREGGERR
jgi:hypothetical protein